MAFEVTDPEPKSKLKEIGIQASPSTCDVKTQFSGYTHSHSNYYTVKTDYNWLVYISMKIPTVNMPLQNKEKDDTK